MSTDSNRLDENPTKPASVHCPFDNCNRFVSSENPWGCECTMAQMCREHFAKANEAKLVHLTNDLQNERRLSVEAFQHGVQAGKEESSQLFPVLAAAVFALGGMCGVAASLFMQWVL